MRTVRSPSVLLVITSYLRFCCSLEIDAGSISIDGSPNSSDQLNDAVPDVTIRLEILVQPPVEYPETETSSHRLLNATSSDPESAFTDPLLVLPTAWEAHATPVVTANTTSQTKGWNSTFWTSTSAIPSSSGIYSNWSANPYGFFGGSTTARRAPVTIIASCYLAAPVIILSGWGVF